MIAASMAAFVNAQAELSSIVKAFRFNRETALSELPTPFCLVDYLDEVKQELFVIGDASRKENPVLSVGFYCNDDIQARDIEIRFRRLIESAKALDSRGVLIPGINLIAYADLLIDEGDHKNYDSNQTGWFTVPTPIVYKNKDANGEPIVVSSGYSIDSTLGKVSFSGTNAPSDSVMATYKCGVIDFNISNVARLGKTDVANNPARFLTVFDLEAFYHIKATANRHF